VSLHGSLSSIEEIQRTLSRDLDETKTQLKSVECELNTVRQNCRQQTDLLSHAASTITTLADQMNKVIALSDNSTTSSSDTTTL